MKYKILICGEAWGEQEEKARTPFVGPAGYQLTSLLQEAGIARHECYLTNVLQLRPPNNDIKTLCVSKAEDTTGLPPIIPGKYLRAEFLPELTRLRKEIEDVDPNIIIALGNIACWALLRDPRISKIRGTITHGKFTRHKVLPTYHPAYVLRQWDVRSIVIFDLAKARFESDFPEVRRPARTIYIDPSLQDLDWFWDNHLAQAKLISTDIETSGDQITCIGFAPSKITALVVPFVDPRKVGEAKGSYWPTLEEELSAWAWVRKVLASPVRKLFQNGLYDLHRLWRGYGLPTLNADEDSMILHHALQPESLKGLGFLGSLYTNESAWKTLRARYTKTIKRDN